MGFETSTPRALDGRDHFSGQTEAFVETLRDKPIEYERECQTDFYLDRPTQRLFRVVQSGVDVSTQIEEGDPDLFDFDYEVEPILETLLAKVLDGGRMELFEEEELQLALGKKRDFELRRNAQLAQVQKLEDNERRLQEEKERRGLQYQSQQQQREFAERKLMGRVLSKQLLQHLRNNSHAMLTQQGFFQQPLLSDLHDNFLPWLYQQIDSQLHTQGRVREETQAVLVGSGQEQQERSNHAIQKEAERRAEAARQREAEKQQREEKKRAKGAKRAEEERAREEAERG